MSKREGPSHGSDGPSVYLGRVMRGFIWPVRFFAEVAGRSAPPEGPVVRPLALRGG